VTATDLAPEPPPPADLAPAPERPPDERVNWRSSIPFIALHFVPLLAIFTGITRTAVILFVITYLGRSFCITAGYHRYFAHRSFRLGRVSQFILAFGATTAAQKGPLWWAGHHRTHHRYSDTDRDLHSPKRGFAWSHVGWILCDKYGPTEYDEIKDFARYPELRFLNKHDWIGPWSLGVACFLIGGWSGLVIGFFASTIVLWHSTFLVNSAAHVFGRRAYDTSDTSRNSLLIALMTGGEGWHNNHHRYPSSARQGFRWWQIDTTYYGLLALARLGIVRDLREPPARILDEARRRERGTNTA
jgi:stearoyl-CoA desaturase (delta-9 desaturase)